MYDALSSDYDYFVNWAGRLQAELPFLEEILGSAAAGDGRTRVLDAACGTGMHAIALAQRGYETAGADFSAGMIERARANARETGVEVEFQMAGFGELGAKFQGYDALLCLGNSLPHLLTETELQEALTDFAACLRPGGVLLVQNRNFDAVMAERSRWMGPEAHRAGEREWLFLRFYDFEQDGLIRFNVVTLYREGSSAWEQKIHSTRLRPQLERDLIRALETSGFERIHSYGSMQGEGFDPEASGNLVIRAYLKG